ncbi:hypothetical protein HOS33_gp323 [Erwinia phage vB_EamM_Y3]|uniref:Uncharacterized protein n=1 Tax=Erwinia phage vB_EamM_Y3 TaxID=1983553 RepID=A0A2H4IBM3_9CAUD|nr:hypothetical protein HOS33_gp323 [Erwinia phage vB_EamM_Y3]ARW58963.1 hypothetical protein Y3_323 [Erwinia phage vB_EamM_Y3]
MAKAKSANAATLVLASIFGVVVENASNEEIQKLLADAGLTVSGGKVVKGKAAKAEKPAAKGKGKKAKAPTVAEIVAAVKEEEELDISAVSEDDLRAAVVKAKLAAAKKAKALDEDDLRELLNEAMGVESEDDEDDEEEDDEEEEDEDDSDDEDEDDSDEEDDEDDEEEDEDDEEEEEDEDDEDEDEDEDELDLDSLDEDELLALVIEHKLAPKAKAKKMDEDELRELCEGHFGGDDEEEEDEDDEDEDFDDEDEDEDDE